MDFTKFLTFLRRIFSILLEQWTSAGLPSLVKDPLHLFASLNSFARSQLDWGPDSVLATQDTSGYSLLSGLSPRLLNVLGHCRLGRKLSHGRKCCCKMSLYLFPVTLPSAITSGPTPSLDMHPHTIIKASLVLTVPWVQVSIHSSVDIRHTNTRPSLPLIFIFDSSVKSTYLQYAIVLLFISLAHSILLILPNERLFTCLPSIVTERF